MRKLSFVFILSAFFVVPARADLVCPKGSLDDFIMLPVWEQYKVNASDYMAQLLRRMARHLQDVLDAPSFDEQYLAAERLGELNATVMKLMFEQGFIAATDIVNAHCVPAPDTLPWSHDIKRENEHRWCRTSGEAFFCPQQ